MRGTKKGKAEEEIENKRLKLPSSNLFLDISGIWPFSFPKAKGKGCLTKKW